MEENPAAPIQTSGGKCVVFKPQSQPGSLTNFQQVNLGSLLKLAGPFPSNGLCAAKITNRIELWRQAFHLGKSCWHSQQNRPSIGT